MSESPVDYRSEQMFQKVERMPPPVRQVFAQLIIGISQKIRTEQRHRGDIIGLGSDRLGKLMAPEQQLPATAHDPLLLKAYKAFYLLNDVGQTALTYLIYEPVCLVELYLESCRQTGYREKPSDIRSILQTSLGQSGDEASGHDLLRELVGDQALLAGQQAIDAASLEDDF